MNLGQAPERLLRTLFEVTQLTIRIDAGGDRATLEITLPEDQLPGITGAAERITEEMLSQGTPSGRPCEVAVRAPGEIRTHTGRVLNPLQQATDSVMSAANAQVRTPLKVRVSAS